MSLRSKPLEGIVNAAIVLLLQQAARRHSGLAAHRVEQAFYAYCQALVVKEQFSIHVCDAAHTAGAFLVPRDYGDLGDYGDRRALRPPPRRLHPTASQFGVGL